jgi:hypothetical protein
MVTWAEYRGIVRLVLLTLLLSFALVAGGLASAGAAFACPMATPTAAAHDCCPDDGSNDKDQGNGGEQSIMDCPFMQLCRTGPVIAPTVEPVRVAAMTPIVLDAPRAMSAPVSAPDDGLFRPPRTI